MNSVCPLRLAVRTKSLPQWRHSVENLREDQGFGFALADDESDHAVDRMRSSLSVDLHSF